MLHTNILNYEKEYIKEPLFNGLDLIYQGNLYKHNPSKPTILIFLGGTAVGKDSVMNELLKRENYFRVKTATSRKRRFEWTDKISDEDKKKVIVSKLDKLSLNEYLSILNKLEDEGFVNAEDLNKYVWMPEKGANENEQEYIKRLITEYKLIENDYHYGNLYGLPKSSLNFNEKNKIGILLTEIDGAIELKEILSKDFNVIVIAFLPDNEEVIKKRLRLREEYFGSTDDHIEERLKEDREMIVRFPQISNYYVRNTEERGIDKSSGREISGIERTAIAVDNLIKSILNK